MQKRKEQVMGIARVIRMPSDKETANAAERNAKAFFPTVGTWFVSKKGDTFVKLDMFADQLFMLSQPKEQAPQQEAGVDQAGLSF